MVYPDIDLKDLYVGSIVTVYSRQLKLVDYGDVFTRKEFAKGKETTFALIKPDVYMHTGKIIDMIYKNGFIISRLKMSRFGPSQASRFLSLG
jgi:nucleoside-diphosphate kinase